MAGKYDKWDQQRKMKPVQPREQKRKAPVSPYRRPGQTTSTVRG